MSCYVVCRRNWTDSFNPLIAQNIVKRTVWSDWVARGDRKGGGGNSHCWVSMVSWRWQWKWQQTAAALQLNYIKNLKPVAGQLMCELVGGQTAPATYLGAILN